MITLFILRRGLNNFDTLVVNKQIDELIVNCLTPMYGTYLSLTISQIIANSDAVGGFTVTLFNKYTPAIIGIAGTILAIILYEMQECISIYYPYHHSFILPLLIVMLTTVGVLIGRLVHKLHYGAYTDVLTGLWNRRYFNRRLSEEMDRTKRNHTAFCLALIDVDNFKHINDTYGHSVGDESLSKIANILKQCTRSTDVITRLGGDEFAIIFPEADMNGVSAIAERMRHGIAKSTQCYQTTISVGVIVVNDQSDVNLIFQEVDDLLFQAKKEKNLVVSSGVDQ